VRERLATNYICLDKWSRLRLSCTTTTTLQVAVDHAFKGTYISRFCPSDPEEADRFPCGDLLHSTQQLIYRCQRYGGVAGSESLLPSSPTGLLLTIGNSILRPKAHKLLTLQERVPHPNRVQDRCQRCRWNPIKGYRYKGQQLHPSP
jgi:hypothetical protein